GNIILRELGKITKLHHNNVEQAPFVVLKSPDIPSILIETGFISNYREERKLRDPIYQRNIARAIARGVEDYFQQHPPPETWFARHRPMRTHQVTRGESLLMIANLYQVTHEELKNLNNLHNDKIFVGQSLKIPAAS